MMMHHFWKSLRLLFLPGSIVLILMACVPGQSPKAEIVAKSPVMTPARRSTGLAAKPQTTKLLDPNFIVFGGGGAPSYNEIAIEIGRAHV